MLARAGDNDSVAGAGRKTHSPVGPVAVDESSRSIMRRLRRNPSHARAQHISTKGTTPDHATALTAYDCRDRCPTLTARMGDDTLKQPILWHGVQWIPDEAYFGFTSPERGPFIGTRDVRPLTTAVRMSRAGKYRSAPGHNSSPGNGRSPRTRRRRWQRRSVRWASLPGMAV